MRRFLPKSLAGQTMLVLLIGLTVSHAVSMAIYSGDRGEAAALIGGRQMAERIAGITRLVAGSPADSVQKMVSVLNEPRFRVSLSRASERAPGGDIGRQSAAIAGWIETQIGGGLFGPVHVRLAAVSDGAGPGAETLRVSVEYGDGQWINFAVPIPEASPALSVKSIFSILIMTLATIFLSIWVVRRLTTPFAAFADAADRLGKDVNAPPLPEAGPDEVRQASQAFNKMQDRLQRFVENRTRMLAAISHDLRTPITLLRLRSELNEDREEQAKIMATLDGMEAIIASTLAFAREDAESEDRRTVDIAALVDSICADMADAGQPVEASTPERLLYDCQPTALKRAFTNLIENAVKYGRKAEVSLTETGQAVTFTVEDEGPGIPEDQLDQVFTPFYRLDQSRNPETGGVGLGLSVAQTVVHAHGGEIIASNRDQGGLRVRVELPK